MEKWIAFYEQFFSSTNATKAFVGELEAITDSTMTKHRAKIMMHQVQRLISLADDIIKVSGERESLQLLFVLICAENIAKLFHNFIDDGQSKAFVHKFFSEFVIGDDRDALENSFFTHDLKPLNLHDTVDILYSIRCDVVHDGLYWGFHFQSGNIFMLNTDPDIIVKITFAEFRAIVVRACIRAIKTYAAKSP